MTESPATAPAPNRTPFQGVRQVIRFNWPFYVTAASACVIGWVAIIVVRVPQPIGLLLDLGIALAAYWLVMSLVVSYYVYDYSELYTWKWIAGWIPDAPQNWANIHAGFDETSLALRQLFPGSDATTYCIDDEYTMTEASIRRARAIAAPVADTMAATPDHIPAEDASLDAVFLIFAGHEVRDRKQRQRFFLELQRVLRAGGQILIVEHVRDWANFLAFGPGFLHFLPRSEWISLGSGTGIRVIQEGRLTPFVRVFLLERDA